MKKFVYSILNLLAFHFLAADDTANAYIRSAVLDNLPQMNYAKGHYIGFIEVENENVKNLELIGIQNGENKFVLSNLRMNFSLNIALLENSDLKGDLKIVFTDKRIFSSSVSINANKDFEVLNLMKRKSQGVQVSETYISLFYLHVPETEKSMLKGTALNKNKNVTLKLKGEKQKEN